MEEEGKGLAGQLRRSIYAVVGSVSD